MVRNVTDVPHVHTDATGVQPTITVLTTEQKQVAAVVHRLLGANAAARYICNQNNGKACVLTVKGYTLSFMVNRNELFSWQHHGRSNQPAGKDGYCWVIQEGPWHSHTLLEVLGVKLPEDGTKVK